MTWWELWSHWSAPHKHVQEAWNQVWIYQVVWKPSTLIIYRNDNLQSTPDQKMAAENQDISRRITEAIKNSSHQMMIINFSQIPGPYSGAIEGTRAAPFERYFLLYCRLDFENFEQPLFLYLHIHNCLNSWVTLHDKILDTALTDPYIICTYV